MEHALKQYRRINGLSAEVLAMKAGTTRQTIHRIENGQQVPSMGMVSKLIKATGGEVRAADFIPPRMERAS